MCKHDVGISERLADIDGVLPGSNIKIGTGEVSAEKLSMIKRIRSVKWRWMPLATLCYLVAATLVVITGVIIAIITSAVSLYERLHSAASEKKSANVE